MENELDDIMTQRPEQEIEISTKYGIFSDCLLYTVDITNKTFQFIHKGNRLVTMRTDDVYYISEPEEVWNH